MEYFEIEGLKRPVSRFVFGTAIASMFEGGDASEILSSAFSFGVNTFDSAHSYGLAEQSLGDWINKNGMREKVNILTKGCNPENGLNRVNVKCLNEDFSESLRRLGTSYIDLFLFHRDDPSQPVGPLIEELNRLVSEGRLRAFGASNWTVERIEEANEYAYKRSLIPFRASSPCFSLAEQIGDPWGGSVHISSPSNAKARQWYIEHRMPVIAYSGLARGFLSGKFVPDGKKSVEESFTRLGWGIAAEYDFPENHERLRRVMRMAEEKGYSVPQIAIAWTLSQRMFVAPILSPSTPEHLKSNIEAFDIRLTEDECAWLDLRG